MNLIDFVKTDYPLKPERNHGKTCLVVGGGPNVWKEWKEAKALAPEAHVMAVNAVGCYVPHATYWFSLHCYYLKQWHEVRRMMYKGELPYVKPILFSLRHDSHDGVKKGDIDAIWQFGDSTIKKSAKHGGSLEDSGFFAMCIAVVLGYSRIWLVGCPADDSGHVFIPEWEYLEHDKAAIKQAWINTITKFPEIPEKVRSMSGLTKELLGYPE